MTGMRLSSSVRVSRQRAGTICQRTLKSSRWVITACLCLGLAFFRVLVAQDNPVGANPVPQPTRRIDLSIAGYQQLSRMARLTDEASLSLDFVDADHVLLTFRQKKLLKRLSDCAPDHDDRLIRAVVLEVPSGKVVKESDWYLHDRRRYLWSLGSGRFLLRKLNSLYIVDSTLRERLLMASPNDLLWVAVTPDKRQIIVETAENPDATPTKGAQSGPAQLQKKAKPQFRLEFLDVDTLVPQRTIKVDAMVSLEGTSTGYADSLHKGSLWLIRFGPTPTERHNIARVRSQTVPRIFYSSNNSLLIGRCPTAACDYSVTAFTVTGRRLWRQRWSQLRFFPAVSRSEDNSRFGVSTLKRSASSSTPVNYDEEDSHDAGAAQDGLEQNVRVFETASGNPVLSVDVSPAVQSGQNFSLSPDGRWLAVLQDSALELYELPQLSDEEKAQFTAVKADVPGLYMLSSKSEAKSESEPEATTESVLQATRIAGNGLPGPAAAGQETPNPNEKAANDAGSGASRPENQPRPSAPSVEAATTTSTEETRESVTTFRVNTSAVLVDVVVTDAKGQAVKGLRQRDFQVMEDGKPQDVRSFREFNDAEGAPIPHTPTAPAPPKPAPNVFTNNTDAPDPGAATMILLDLLNTPLADQQYARQQLVKFLKAKARKSQIALCVLSSNQAASLLLIQGFTPDENVLLAAIAGKKGMPHMAAWQAAAAGTGNAVNAVAELAQGDPNSWQGLLHGLEQLQAEGQATDTDARVGSTIDALTQLARYLSGIPGRKNLVWLSGSFPLSMSPSAVADHPALDSRNYATAIKRVTNLLGEGQIAVYPVDVRGPFVGVSAADNIGIAAGGGPIPSAPGQLSSSGDTAVSPNEASQQRMMQELASRSAERSTMNQFAADTGGKAFFNSNAVEDAIATATEQGSSYYTLSYSPANRNYNGRFRQIRVALAQRGYHLHYRQGYFAEDFSGPAKDGDASRNISTAAMQHGSPQSRQIHFAVQVVPMGSKKKVDSARAGELLLASRKKPSLPAMVEMQHYAIDYAVDSSDLRFLPLKNQIHHSMLNFMIAAYSDDGRQLSGVSTAWTSDLSPTVYKDVINGGVRIHQEVDLPTEAVSLRLGLQDKVSNHLGTIELPLPVPAPPDVPRTVKHSLPEIEPD